MSRIRKVIWLAVAVAALALAPVAHADYRQAIRDCAMDGRLHQHYSQADLRKALKHLPADINEYTDCASVLNAALNGGSGGGQLSTTNPGLITPSGAVAGSQSDLNALKGLKGRPTIRIGNQMISPGLFKLASRAAENPLPLPLLLSLLALAAMGALAGLFVMRRRWPATRRIALRILRR